MYFKILEINVLKHMNLILLIFYLHTELAWQASLKKTGIKLEFLTDNMLMMVEKGIRGGICHAIHRYSKTNHKYMKNFDRTKNHHIFSI